MDNLVAWHFTDPGCPWGYSSRPAIARLRWRFGSQVDWRLVMIGLSETTEEYEAKGLSAGMLAKIQPMFERRFGMPFGAGVKSRIAGTSRGCRAVVAAREQDPELGYAALRALQLTQFTTTRLLDSDEDLHWALGGVAGLDADAAVGRIDAPDIVAAYEEDRARARSAEGAPTHVQDRHADADGSARYTAPSVIFERPGGERIEVGGFQSFEAYDTALANLAPDLERRPAPERAREAVEEYPIGLTTAEVASILRPSDLDEIDIAGARRELTEAAAEGEVVCLPAGSDALWLPPGAVPEPAGGSLAAAGRTA